MVYLKKEFIRDEFLNGVNTDFDSFYLLDDESQVFLAIRY